MRLVDTDVHGFPRERSNVACFADVTLGCSETRSPLPGAVNLSFIRARQQCPS